MIDQAQDYTARVVRVEYLVSLPPSEINPSGRIAGERYDVASVELAQRFHPDAAILFYVDNGERYDAATYDENTVQAVQDGEVQSERVGPSDPQPVTASSVRPEALGNPAGEQLESEHVLGQSKPGTQG